MIECLLHLSIVPCTFSSNHCLTINKPFFVAFIGGKCFKDDLQVKAVECFNINASFGNFVDFYDFENGVVFSADKRGDFGNTGSDSAPPSRHDNRSQAIEIVNRFDFYLNATQIFPNIVSPPYSVNASVSENVYHFSPSSPALPPNSPPPDKYCTLDFLRITGPLNDTSLEDGIRENVIFEPDGYIHGEFILMQRFMRQSIESDTYRNFQCISAQMRRLSCLDIGTVHTLNSLIQNNDMSTFQELPNGNMLGSPGSYLLYGANCYPFISGDHIINSFDVSVLMWSFFADNPYEQTKLTDITTYGPQTPGLCDFVTNHNIDRANYSIEIAHNPCNPYELGDEESAFISRKQSVAKPIILKVVTWSQLEQGKWVRILFEDSPVSTDIYVLGTDLLEDDGILFTSLIPLERDCKDCTPISANNKLTVYVQQEENCPTVVGATSSPVYKGVINLRQRPPENACQFTLYIWFPRNSSSPTECENDMLAISRGSMILFKNFGGILEETVCEHTDIHVESSSDDEFERVHMGSSWLPQLIFFVSAFLMIILLVSLYRKRVCSALQ